MNRKYLKVLSVFLVLILVTGCTSKKDSSDAKKEKELNRLNSNFVLMSIEDVNSIVEGVSEVKITINNYEKKSITFGQDYLLQKYTEGRWEDVPLAYSVLDFRYVVEPQKACTYTCEFETRLESGKYRLIKNYNIDNQIELGTKEISVEFNVKKR